MDAERVCFLIPYENFMINIFYFWEYFVFRSGEKNTITAFLSFLSFSIGLTQKVTIVPCYHVKFLSVGFRVFHDLCGVCRNAIARSFF